MRDSPMITCYDKRMADGSLIDNEYMKSMVRGFTWKIRFWNDAVFAWWTPEKVSRKEAKIQLMDIANRGEGNSIYQDSSEDIKNIWETKSRG